MWLETTGAMFILRISQEKYSQKKMKHYHVFCGLGDSILIEYHGHLSECTSRICTEPINFHHSNEEHSEREIGIGVPWELMFAEE